MRATGNGNILDMCPQSSEIFFEYGIIILFFLNTTSLLERARCEGEDRAGTAGQAVPVLVPGYVLAAALVSHPQSCILSLLARGTDIRLFVCSAPFAQE